MIKDPIKFTRLYPNSLVRNVCLEATIAEVCLKNDESLVIISAYAAGNHKREFILELESLFKELKITSTAKYFILAGDLNARHSDWQNLTNNPRGISLKKWIEENEINLRLNLLGSELPSYPRGNSFLDICIADSRLEILNLSQSGRLETLNYDSDHNAIKMRIAKDQSFRIVKTPVTHKYNFNKVDWPKFISSIAEEDSLTISATHNLNNQEIDGAIEHLDKIITTAIERSVPKIKKFNSAESYVNPNIQQLQRHKSYLISNINRLYKAGTTRNLVRINIIKELLKDTKDKLKAEFAKSISNYWENKIKNISYKDSKTMFPMVNAVFRAKGRSEIPTLRIPQMKRSLLDDAGIPLNALLSDQDNNLIISNPQHKLNVIGAHFQAANNQNADLGSPRLSEIVNKKCRELEEEIVREEVNEVAVTIFSSTNLAFAPSDENIKNYFTSVGELRKIFRKLNNKRSASFDGIPNIILKNLPIVLIFKYAIIFNNALNNKYFPEKWKKAKVIALKKKDKDGSDPSSYRPISLLPNISKIFEVIINQSILSFCAKNDVMPDQQFGFRYEHSTLHAVNKFTSDICWSLNNNNCVGACFIDLEKAFDTVWLEGLFYKLLKKNFPLHLVKMIWSMLHGKKFLTCDGHLCSSKSFLVTNGLQQGTVNSPMLFNLYTCDLLALFGLNSDANKKAIAFADDLLIYAYDRKVSTVQGLVQDLFNKIKGYFHSWKLKINTSKCESILFKPKLKLACVDVRRNWRKFKIKEAGPNGREIPHKAAVKYLGITIDENVNFNKHVTTQLQKAKKAFKVCSRLFYNKNLCTRVKTLCYLLLIRPVLTYGAPIWFNINATRMEKLRIFERFCLRACLNMYRSPRSNFTRHFRNSEVYNAAQVHRIDMHILKLIRNHIASASTSRINSLIYGPFYPQFNYQSAASRTGFVPPEAFTYLDAKGLIQDVNKVPTIYHIKRGSNQKAFLYDSDIVCQTINPNIMYDISLPDKDLKDNYRKNVKKYWWLDQNIP